MIFLISVGAFLATFLGGIFALRFRDRLHLILGFSAGAVIAVAFFDLLPEAIELGSEKHDPSFITTMVALGFVIFMLLDRFSLFHCHEESHDHNKYRGNIGAGGLSIHSFLDGVAIGLAFQVSSAVGVIVSIAVLVHDFSDGINTVSVILKNGGDRRTALKWLFSDSLAPVLGVLTTLFFSIKESSIGIILAIFCGFFLYIGASDLLPESHHKHPTIWTTISTIIGMLVLYTAVKIAGV